MKLMIPAHQAVIKFIVIAFIVITLSTASAAGYTDLQNKDITVLIPANNSTHITPVPLGDAANRYGYLTINSIDVSLIGTTAEITVDYKIEPWIKILVITLGREDLKKRILGVINYPDAGREQIVTFKYFNDKKAIITVTNTVIDYHDGSFWYNQHEFGTIIPRIVFHISDTDKKWYYNIKLMPKGFGYFQ